jgi:hypothetical protein
MNALGISVDKCIIGTFPNYQLLLCTLSCSGYAQHYPDKVNTMKQFIFFSLTILCLHTNGQIVTIDTLVDPVTVENEFQITLPASKTESGQPLMISFNKKEKSGKVVMKVTAEDLGCTDENSYIEIMNEEDKTDTFRNAMALDCKGIFIIPFNTADSGSTSYQLKNLSPLWVNITLHGKDRTLKGILLLKDTRPSAAAINTVKQYFQ